MLLHSFYVSLRNGSVVYIGGYCTVAQVKNITHRIECPANGTVDIAAFSVIDT